MNENTVDWFGQQAAQTENNAGGNGQGHGYGHEGGGPGNHYGDGYGGDPVPIDGLIFPLLITVVFLIIKFRKKLSL